MKFEDLYLFLESVKTHRGYVVPIGTDFEGTVEGFFYLWAHYSFPKAVQIPSDIQKIIEPHIKYDEEFYEATTATRGPATEAEQERVQNAILELQHRHPVAAQILSVLKITYCRALTREEVNDPRFQNHPNINTAAVDPRGNLFINLGYLNRCDDEGLIGLLAHEAMHIALKHHARLAGRAQNQGEFNLINWATDSFINDELMSDGYKIGEGRGGVHIKNGEFVQRLMILEKESPDIGVAKPTEYQLKINIRDMTWEQLYEELLKELSEGQNFERVSYNVPSLVYNKENKYFGIIFNQYESPWSNTTDYELLVVTEGVARKLAKDIFFNPNLFARVNVSDKKSLVHFIVNRYGSL